MGSIIAEGICCCCMCCCKDIANSMEKLLGTERVTKIYYLLLVAVFAIPAIFVFFFLNRWQSFLSYFSWMSCPSSSGGAFECIGSSAVYRISLSLLALFLLMMILMVCRNKLSMIVNQGLFCVKYLLVLGLFIGFLFISNTVFTDYAQASKYISILFMLLQSIILIDLFYLAGIKLVNRYDQGQRYCGCVLIFLTILIEGLAVLMNVLGYVYFSSSDDCGNTVWVNIITSIILLAMPFLQLLNFNKQNSLLTTSLISLYISYLAFICQYSYGGSSCVGRMTIPSLIADIAISTFFFILTMYGSIMGGSGQIKVTQNGDINKAMGVAPTQARPDEQEAKKIEEKQNNKNAAAPSIQQNQIQQVNQAKYTEGWRWVKWHFYMCLASIYIAMLITNWTSANITTGELNSNDFGFWVRLILSWVTFLLYVWTLIAPRVFPDRDFTVV